MVTDDLPDPSEVGDDLSGIASIAETSAIIFVVGLILGAVLEVLKFVGAINNNPLKPLLNALGDTISGNGLL
jgi:hypothetical protein